MGVQKYFLDVLAIPYMYLFSKNWQNNEILTTTPRLFEKNIQVLSKHTQLNTSILVPNDIIQVLNDSISLP